MGRSEQSAALAFRRPNRRWGGAERRTSILPEAKPWRRRNSVPPSNEKTGPPEMEWSISGQRRRITSPRQFGSKREQVGLNNQPPWRFGDPIADGAARSAVQAFCRRQNLGGGGIQFRRAMKKPGPRKWNGPFPGNAGGLLRHSDLGVRRTGDLTGKEADR